MQYVGIWIFLIWVFFLHLRLTITTAITYKSNSLQFYLCVSCKKRRRKKKHIGRISAPTFKTVAKRAAIYLGATQTHFIDRERENKRRHLHRMEIHIFRLNYVFFPAFGWIWFRRFCECICVGNITTTTKRQALVQSENRLWEWEMLKSDKHRTFLHIDVDNVNGVYTVIDTFDASACM